LTTTTNNLAIDTFPVKKNFFSLIVIFSKGKNKKFITDREDTGKN
jgi:kynurenine formamidase